ncbi:MAG: flagellar basal body rod protein FlgB [Thermoguttaceae bacterium]|jgi:flagellar basal-body rod protein FlgB
MLSGLFQSSTIPVLQEVVSFSQARHAILAGNIANIDTPGYQARDLSVADFQARLKQAIDDRDQPPIGSPGETELAPKPLMAEVAKSSRSILRHDMGNVDMESQVTEMVKNEMQHNMALTILTDQFHQLQTAIRGTVT